MVSITKEVLIQSILKAERQWKRNCRIAHAKLRIAEAVSQEDREVWTEILKRNGEMNERKATDNRRRNKAKASQETRVARRTPKRNEIEQGAAAQAA